METARLLLRRWRDSDAASLYEYAGDPQVGPPAGWPVHKSVEDSLQVIRLAFSTPEKYALCLKPEDKPIGTIGLLLKGETDKAAGDDECELGYWLGRPFWGRGLMPETVREMLRHAFEDLAMQTVWIGFYEGNTKSKRVIEKCGFSYRRTDENVDVPLLHEKRTLHVYAMTAEEWAQNKMKSSSSRTNEAE